jgi:hypothetical protein
MWLFRLSHSFIFFWLHFLSFYIWLYVLYASVKLPKLCIFIVMFLYFYCYVWNILCILFHCFVLCIVCVEMCNVLLPLGVSPIAVNKYLIIRAALEYKLAELFIELFYYFLMTVLLSCKVNFILINSLIS